IAAVFLWLSAKEEHAISSTPKIAPVSEKAGTRLTERHLVDAEGVHYRYTFDLRIGVVLSIFVGYLSSVLGVGGGFIHVPALTRLLNFPVHVATATSHFILTIMALTGTGVHLARGVFVHGARRTAILAVGVILGAQLGAYMSTRLGGKVIIRGLALAMIFVGIRLILTEI